MTDRPTRDDPGRVPGTASTARVPVYVAAAAAVLAVLFAAAALATGWGVFAWIAAMAVACAAAFWALSGLGRNASRRVRREGSVVTVKMRRAWPATSALSAAVLAGFLSQVALDPYFGAGLRLATGGCAVMLLLALPDLVRATLTGGRVMISPDRIEIRTWSTDAAVDWADVESVGLDPTVGWLGGVRISTRPGAPPPVLRRRRILVPLEKRHPEGCVVINAVALDEPWVLSGWLDALARQTPEARNALLEAATVDMLSGRWPQLP